MSAKSPGNPDAVVHRFTDDYLARCRGMSKEEIARFLEHYRRYRGGTTSPARRTSLQVPENLLEAFKVNARLNGTSYQAKIKELMSEWVRSYPTPSKELP